MIWLQRVVLGVAGSVAFGIGVAILSAPMSFYATYGIDLGSQPNLLSELRAPGANLAVLGAIILAGAVHSRIARLSATLGAMVFLAYAFGRLVSMALDGMPSHGLIEATLIEFAIGGLCAILLWRGKSRRSVGDHGHFPIAAS
jgi:hypothetical protein